MRKITKLLYSSIAILLILLYLVFYPLPFVHADELEDIAKQIAELEKARQMSVEATKPLESELSRLEAKLNNIQVSLQKAEDNILLLEKSISQREKDFEIQYVLLAQRVESYYKRLRRPSGFLVLLSTQTTSGLVKDLSYRQAVADEDKRIIAQISEELLELEADKKKVEADKLTLAALKEKTDQQAAFFKKEISGAKKYQTELSTKIAQLTAKQQQLIAEKLGSLNLPMSLGAGPLVCVDDRKLDPGFSPAFAFYTYGIPHYVGMNQYGAYGRAKAHQDYKTILTAYYQNTNVECRDVPAEIDVQGYGRLPFEEYIKGVVNKEMGADIPEALKAQAIAARSYALNQSQPICTTQYCQVYSSARRGAANDAVDATGKNVCGDGRAEVLVSGGQVITAWYASTFGGYAHRSSVQLPNAGNTSYTKNFADASGSVNNFSELHEKAYDKESKCFYAAQGWREENGNSAWLRSTEVADIANVILLARKDPSIREHLCQTDKPPNPKYCREIWNEERVKQELRNRNIGPMDTASSVSVTGVDWGSGRTTQITINGVSFDGNEFKDWFNLRAPANIQIVGPLFNIEKK